MDVVPHGDSMEWNALHLHLPDRMVNAITITVTFIVAIGLDVMLGLGWGALSGCVDSTSTSSTTCWRLTLSMSMECPSE